MYASFVCILRVDRLACHFYTGAESERAVRVPQHVDRDAQMRSLARLMISW